MEHLIVLALYLAQVGLSEQQIGLLLSLTLVGDVGISLWITTSADRIGRRRMLVLSAALMIVAGVVLVFTSNPVLLTAAAIVGIVSPSGNEIGPFLSIEQAALSQLVPNERRTQVFAWYHLVGSFATALGALIGGGVAQSLQNAGLTALASYRVVLIGYACIGAVLVILFLCLSSSIEATTGDLSPRPLPVKRMFGLHQSRRVVVRLSALFALDVALAPLGTSFFAACTVQHDTPDCFTGELMGTLFQPDGVVFRTQTLFARTAGLDQRAVALAPTRSELLATWETGQFFDGCGYESLTMDVTGARITGSGTASGIFPITHLEGVQTHSGVACNGGDCLVVWQDGRHTPPESWPWGSFDIYGARVRRDGGVIESNGFLISSTLTGPVVLTWRTPMEITYGIVTGLRATQCPGQPGRRCSPNTAPSNPRPMPSSSRTTGASSNG